MDDERDIWRDSLLRYLGYANELGESFRPILPKLYLPSYILSFSYVLGHTYSMSTNAVKEVQEAENLNMKMSEGKFKVVNAAVDTLLWQGLASVVIPGFTINRVVKLSKSIIKQSSNSKVLARWGPTAIGLGIIPIIIHPIDKLVDDIMNATIRQYANHLQERLHNKAI